jgi:uncharacterized membrane protein
MNFIKEQFPENFEAINWINQNISGQPIMLEAVGDSYTLYNQISATTGLPTVQGWLVHEWLWRGGYDQPGARAADVEKIYTSSILNDEEKPSTEYIVVSGDSLWKISKEKLLNEYLWKKIASLNNIENPSLIFPNQKIILPTQETENNNYSNKNFITKEQFKSLLQKYNVDYIFLGANERKKYAALNENNFIDLGFSTVFETGKTKIYKVTK